MPGRCSNGYKPNLNPVAGARITAEVKTWAGVEEACVFFNNDIDASAIGNARQMVAMV